MNQNSKQKPDQSPSSSDRPFSQHNTPDPRLLRVITSNLSFSAVYLHESLQPINKSWTQFLLVRITSSSCQQHLLVGRQGITQNDAGHIRASISHMQKQQSSLVFVQNYSFFFKYNLLTQNNHSNKSIDKRNSCTHWDTFS